MRRVFVAALAAWPFVPLAAQQAAADSGLPLERIEQELGWQRGDIVIAGGRALLRVPESFRYLPPDDAERVLVAWGNPPGFATLGMLFPAAPGPFAAGGWGVVITYEGDGHVKDDDAAKLNYDELLREMQKASVQENRERAAAGFEPVHLVGWAEPPRYDRSSHKLYWAKELRFGDNPAHTLNYNIRVLGKDGVLVLNAVAEMTELDAVRAAMQEVLGFVDFTAGNRYTDFVEGKDKVAAYGIAALVAGAVASKAGFFKVLLAGLLAAKKVLAVGAVVLVAGLRKWWSRRRQVPTA
ncbi:MAG TPA: DUF2167 domain-containing protein [Gemmatimonadales bacterium]|nr:DUF2167 domain-containing protein [Gemmatimonadales bacterium]